MFKLNVPDEEFSEGEVDFSIETVGDILDGYQVSVYNEKQEQVKIMQDQTPRHSSFKEREREKESSAISSSLKKSPKKSLSSKQKSTKTKRGPRATKYEKDCTSRCKSRYKRRNEIIKSLRDLKVVTGDDSVICFYRHPVDGNNDESVLFATTTTLIRAFKTLLLNQSIALETPDSPIVQDVTSVELLALATPSKSNEKAKKIPKKRINEENYCRMCCVKHNSKLDKDFESP